MATIFIHHHADDLLAAEILAGAMVSLCRVALVAYPCGPQRVLSVAHDEMTENIILWTYAAEAEDAMQRLVNGFEVRRAHFILLTQAGVEPPERLGRGVAAPFYDRATPWLAYRNAMRNLLIGRLALYGAPPPPRRVRLPGLGLESLAATVLSNRDFPLGSVIVLGVITLWAMSR